LHGRRLGHKYLYVAGERNFLRVTEKTQKGAVFRLQPQSWSSRKRVIKPTTAKALEVWEVKPLRHAVVKPKKIRREGGRREVSGGSGVMFVAKQYSVASGPELLERIKALGFSVDEFANRTGVSRSAVTKNAKRPAGYVPLWLFRLLEFEEFLAAVAKAIDKRRAVTDESTIRADVETAFDRQVASIAGRETSVERRG
jgi:transcriptional regulator with XRE-family HTH domain